MALSGDLKNAFRQLASAPGFTLAVVLSLAFGIGANAAIFTLLNSLLWRPLPVAAPETLVQVGPAGSWPDQPGAVLSGVLKGPERRSYRRRRLRVHYAANDSRN